MAWITDAPLIGRKVEIVTGYGDNEPATVLAVSDRSTMIKVRALNDGKIMVGNQWKECD